MTRILLFLALCAIIGKSHGENLPANIKYLIKYGYIPLKKGGTPESYSNKEIDSALKNAQKFGNIPVTGKLDSATIKMLDTPRCGLPDNMESKFQRYVNASKWHKTHLTYGFDNYSPKLRPLLLENKFHEAFPKWAKPTGLQFSRVLPESADIRIGFYAGDHGDGDPFDGPGKVLAHANYPNPIFGCHIHMDDEENWILTEHPEEGNSVLSVFIHELGHALGLGHSDNPKAVMYPFDNGLVDLDNDDILGIQSLYGKAS